MVVLRKYTQQWWQCSTCWLIQENDEIRCASIYLMGNLSKFGSGEQVFTDQIHNVLVSLLLHLVDPNPQVVKVEKEADTRWHTLLSQTKMPSCFNSLISCRRASLQCECALLWWDQNRSLPCSRTTSMTTRVCTTESSSMISPSTW